MSATPLLETAPVDNLSATLAEAAPFSSLPQAVLDAIAAISCERACVSGETLLAFGQFDGSEFYYVVDGRLKAAHADETGGAVLIEEINGGAFFGLSDAIAEGETDKAERLTLSAETDSVVITIDAAAFRQIVAHRPSLTKSLMRYFAGLLASYSVGAPVISDSPVRRVFAALMEHIERDAVTGAWKIARMPKHRELADAASTDESIAANAVAQLILDGVARREYPGLIIQDMTEFSRLAG